MSEVLIKTRENGPLLVTGPIRLVDHSGNVYDLTGKESVALCRCGHSSKKPFCDGSHRNCGFVAGETAPPAAPLVAGSLRAPAVLAFLSIPRSELPW